MSVAQAELDATATEARAWSARGVASRALVEAASVEPYDAAGFAEARARFDAVMAWWVEASQQVRDVRRIERAGRMEP